jgi:uncharacterized tellurite resistance protein B-like protein
MEGKHLVAGLVDAVRRFLGPSDGDSKQPYAQPSSLRYYRTAAQIACADGELNDAERDRLDALAHELALSENQVTKIEREVLDSLRLIPPSSSAPTSDTYNLLDNKPWVDLAEGSVELLDELDRQMPHFDSARQELADHVILRLEEVLQRSGVDVISEETVFDRSRHKLARADPQIAPGAIVTKTLSPGFAIGPRVLRRARVQVEGRTADGSA